MSSLAPSSFPDSAARLIAEAEQSAAAYGEGANYPHQVGYLRATVRDLCAQMEPIKETPHDKLRRLVRELIAACEAADAPNCDGMDTVLDRLDEAKESLEEVTWADLDEMYAAFVVDRGVR